MKIFLGILAVAIIAILVLGYLFVQWANRPENVEALKKDRQETADKKIADEKKQAELAKEIEAKRANLKLVVDENLAEGRFQSLDFDPNENKALKFADGKFKYDALVTKGQNATEMFIFSKEDFEDFAAEMELEIWGYGALAGIVWGAETNGKNYAIKYQAAYSSPGYLTVKTDGKKTFGLGGIVASENKQLIRVEKFGKNIAVSVNGKPLFDKSVESSSKGKIGLYFAHRGGGDYPETIKVSVKTFKIWR